MRLRFVFSPSGLIGLLGCGRGRQKSPAQSESLAAEPVSQESEAANADKSFGQNMQKETPQELIRLQCHRPPFPAVCIILPEEGHLFSIEVQQAVVRNGYAMGIAAEIADDLRGAAESRPDIHNPVILVQLAHELGELFGIA